MPAHTLATITAIALPHLIAHPSMTTPPPRTAPHATSPTPAPAHSAILAVHRLDPTRAPEQLAGALDALAPLAGVHHAFVLDDHALADLTGVDPHDIPVSHGNGMISVFVAPDDRVLFSVRGDPARVDHAAHIRAEFERTTRPAPLDHYNLPKNSALAVEGYDPVSYFTDSRPAKGRAELESVHRGVTYRFATDEHRRLFNADPDRYAPTYGGWCASAMGDGGRKVGIDPTNFKIKDGRLFLFFKGPFADALKDWNKHEREWEPAADQHWRTISGEPPRIPTPPARP